MSEENKNTGDVPLTRNVPEEGIAAEPETQNTKPETEAMEVHHHSHSHGKKTWKAYFWEFLMLFLAVFCGFLAEYLLEHRIEKERAKQFIVSFYEDLKTDTARLTFIINYDNRKIAALADMADCYDAVLKNFKTSACMGKLVNCSKTNRSFAITDRTLRQLANAGGFRLLSKGDADSIIYYENFFKQYRDFEATVFQDSQNNVRNTLNLMADFRVNRLLQGTTIGADTLSVTLTEPLLFSDDKHLLNKYFNELLIYQRVTTGQRNILSGLKVKTIGLLEYYKNKYHFE